MGGLIQFLIPVFMILLGLFVGKWIEKRHLRTLDVREADLEGVIVCNLRRFPANLKADNSFLVVGSVVIATDYFKVFAAGLRNLFGGEMRTYRSLMRRARREALVRMLQQAKERGAYSVWNVRFETATIQGKRKPGGVEVLAYATAVKVS
jgi:uncharacterized protein YbjQ (UPF0145 family)